MSDNNSTDTPTVDIDDLDALSTSLFGQENEVKVTEEPASSEEPKEEDSSETDGDDTEDNEESGDDTQEDEEDNSEDSDNEDANEEPEQKPKKGGRFQERINELTTARREAERRATDAETRIAALEARLANPQNDKEPTKAEAPTQAAELRAPDPTDKNEDGTDKYALGEFDPQYIRDLTRHTFDEMARESEAKSAQSREAQEAERKAAEAQAEWENKIAPAKERYPDFAEKAASLEPLFTGVEQSYGEYLAQTLMAMDHGTDVLYYLAENLDEAERIIKSGATRATMALGRIEAKFMDNQEEQPQPKKVARVTKAPTPPAHQNKGSAAARPSVPPDTDDLDAFATEFFKRK